MPIRIGGRLFGLATWALITFPIWGAILAPLVLCWAILAFNVYWLVRSGVLAIGATIGYLRLRRDVAIDWLGRARDLPGFESIHHLVLIPTYNEPEAVLCATLDRLAAQDFPSRRLAIVLAFEAREPGAPNRARHLLRRYRGHFGALWALFHPTRPGDVPGKSSNLAWAGPRARRLLEHRGVPADHVLVTVCDADSRLHQRYLSALTDAHLSDPNRADRLYQPAILFHANLNRLPPLLRAANCAHSAWSLARLAFGSRLVLQSTYSLPLELCAAVGYWDRDVIPEDSRLCFKVMLLRGEPARVRPIYLPVLADAAEGATLWDTVVAQYQQIRRWAWGVSDITYVLAGLARARGVRPRLSPAVGFIEDHVVWPTHWFLITLGVNLLPPLAPWFAGSPEGVALLNLAGTVLALGLPGLLAALTVDRLLRGRPEHLLEWPLELLGWVLMPVLALAFIALPALDAHTRLLLGRTLTYQSTPKFAR